MEDLGRGTWDVVDGRISYRTYGKKFACSLPMNLLEARPVFSRDSRCAFMR